MSGMMQVTKVLQERHRASRVGKQPYHAGKTPYYAGGPGSRKNQQNTDERRCMDKTAEAYGVPYDHTTMTVPWTSLGKTDSKDGEWATLTFQVGQRRYEYKGFPVPNPFYHPSVPGGATKSKVPKYPLVDFEEVLNGQKKFDLTSPGSLCSEFELVSVPRIFDLLKVRCVNNCDFMEADPYQKGLKICAIQHIEWFYGVDPLDNCVRPLLLLIRKYREWLIETEGTDQDPYWMERLAIRDNDLFSIPRNIFSDYLKFANERFKTEHPGEISEEPPLEMEYFEHDEMKCILLAVLSRLADNWCDTTNAAWKSHKKVAKKLDADEWYHNENGHDITFHKRSDHVNVREGAFNVYIFKDNASRLRWHGYKNLNAFVHAIEYKSTEFGLAYDMDCHYLNYNGRNTDLPIRMFKVEALLSAMMQSEGDKFRSEEMYAVYKALCNGEFPEDEDVFDAEIYNNICREVEAAADAAAKAKADAEAETEAAKAQAEAETEAAKAQAEADAAAKAQAAELAAELAAAKIRLAELEKQLRDRAELEKQLRDRAKSEKRQRDEAEAGAEKRQRKDAEAGAEAEEFAA